MQWKFSYDYLGLIYFWMMILRELSLYFSVKVALFMLYVSTGVKIS